MSCVTCVAKCEIPNRIILQTYDIIYRVSSVPKQLVFNDFFLIRIMRKYRNSNLAACFYTPYDAQYRGAEKERSYASRLNSNTKR